MKKDKKNLTDNRNYEFEDYKREDTESIGLATSHEQVSDYYMSGDCVPLPEKEQDKSLPRKNKEE
jgi:Protein of unknown function (DUF4025)